MISKCVNEINKRHGLSHAETFLLDFVALKLGEGNVIHVKDLINQNQVASQATLHKALTSLVNKDLLRLIVAKNDGRLKVVMLTKLANKRLGELDRTISKVAYSQLSKNTS